MIVFTKTQGDIQTIDGDHSCIVFLRNFIGEVTSISLDCKYLTFVADGNCEVISDISITNSDKLDILKIRGRGKLAIGKLAATTIEIYSEVSAKTISANVVKIYGANLSSNANIDEDETFIKAIGHVWVVDSILNCEKYKNGIDSPYVLIDNSLCDLTGHEKAILSENALSVENCRNVSNLDISFKCEPCIEDGNAPKRFIYALLRDDSGKVVQVLSRRKLYGYDIEGPNFIWPNASNALISGEQIIPAQVATPYDVFKHSTQYTNVDIHRWINQAGEVLKGLGSNYITDETINAICNAMWTENPDDWEAIPKEIINRICEILPPEYVYDGHPHSSEPMSIDTVNSIMNGSYDWPKKNSYALDEVDSRNYELGLYSLNSYRTADLKFYEQNNPVSEEREMP